MSTAIAGAFTVAQARRVLAAGRAFGLVPRLHAEQLARTAATRLAIELDAASADHLEKINSADIRALAASNVVATLLPGCCFHLGLSHYPSSTKTTRRWRCSCPGHRLQSRNQPHPQLAMAMSLACSQMHMKPCRGHRRGNDQRSLSLRRHMRAGSIEVGKYADLAIFDVEDYREIPLLFWG